MRERNNSSDNYGCILLLPVVISSYFLISCIFDFSSVYKKVSEGDTGLLSLIFCALLILIVCAIILFFLIQKGKYEKYFEDKHKLMLQQEKQSRKEIDEIKKDYEGKLSQMELINQRLTDLIKTKTPFKDVSILCADFETAIYEKDEHYLRYKPRPAKVAADKVKEIKTLLNKNISEYKQMLYKYEFLISVFPELNSYFENDEQLVHIKDYSIDEDVDVSRDRVKDWVTDEEYRNLNIDERNQLALNRYKSRKKSNWEIGIEYELYIGYLLREGKPPFNKEFNVIQFGEMRGLNDLGRDIIAEQADSNGKKTYIIQCKRWSETRVVHENAICQLYGTTVVYRIKQQDMHVNIIPMFITTTELSEMAKEFAKRLGVIVMKIPIGDYPMIKCNINNGEKIYHLPFDQQYHRAEIKNEGEFYAMTVKEATSKGFRRAKRHLFI